ncbi:hypothetical protein HPB49_014863 [Dermacentor silvarum]|uniref:Uncharacterized protein n=1 Tax=Dermacentor silvarum TaxID=543639 RepID=A0ACB8D644_DERSI|nr:hypothetical protein HPB49_014863 [Dermacentor silvarum]
MDTAQPRLGRVIGLSLFCKAVVCFVFVCRSTMGQYASFMAALKLNAIDYAMEHGNRAAGRHFGVDEIRIRFWKKQREKLMTDQRTRRAFHGPKIGKFPHVEEAVLEYVKDLREDACAVSVEMVQTQARTIARKLGIATKDFRASSVWTTRFMRRNGLSLRRRTSLCQQLPSTSEDKVIDFHHFVTRICEKNDFFLSQIGNADQTPLTFDMPRNTTVNEKGARSVLVKTSGAQKQRCTVMLAVTADGRKLPPHVILKRETFPVASTSVLK